MNKFFKRLALLLAVLMIVSMMPVQLFADNSVIVEALVKMALVKRAATPMRSLQSTALATHLSQKLSPMQLPMLTA